MLLSWSFPVSLHYFFVGINTYGSIIRFNVQSYKFGPYIYVSGPIKCETNSDCPDYLACGEDEVCVDPPCPNCTANAHCEVKDHVITGTCICNSGYMGCNAYGKSSLYDLSLIHI